MSLKIANAKIRDAVLKGVPSSGPPSLRSRWARRRYQSPEGLDAAFDEALSIVTREAEAQRQLASKATDAATKERHAALAEVHNPEVKYNHLVQHMDLAEPVYKLLAKRDWQNKPMLVLMQRLEQHHVIPDTLPTLDPKADVQLKFVTPQMRNTEPGEWIASEVSMRRPWLEIRDFSVPAGKSAKYTVLIVNPDVPNVETDSFDNFLQFAATNVEASLAQPLIKFNEPGTNVVVPYLPPMPEKNGPVQRLCLWVLRQPEGAAPLNVGDLTRLNFDIREFTAQHNLEPVGATLWRSKYDRHTPTVREKYHQPPGRVFFRARTAKPEESLLHLSERKKWMKVDGLELKE